MANIIDYLHSINTSKCNIKRALLDVYVKNPTNDFNVYPDKLEECDTTPRVTITTSAGSRCDVPIIEECNYDDWNNSLDNDNIFSSKYWNSIVYGNGKYVAVSGNGTCAYSLDGITWNQCNMTGDNSWNTITYGNGKFIAIADMSNICAYSSDGITWFQSTLPTSGNWKSISYGIGKFIAILNNSNICAYSSDGITWSTAEMPSTAAWYSISRNAEQFIAIANGSDIFAYSTDGITWVQGNLSLSSTWYSICCTRDNNDVVIATNSNNCRYSSNGVNWYKSNLPITADWRSICYGNGKFIAIAAGNILAYSTNGKNWVLGNLPITADWRSICYGNGKFIATSNSINPPIYLDANFGTIRNDSLLIPTPSCFIVEGYSKNLINSITKKGTYLSSIYSEDIEAFIDTRYSDKPTLYIISGGGKSTAYEHIWFSTSYNPEEDGKPVYPYGGSGSADHGIYDDTNADIDIKDASLLGSLYVTRCTGGDGKTPIDLSLEVSSRNSTDDHYLIKILTHYAT